MTVLSPEEKRQSMITIAVDMNRYFRKKGIDSVHFFALGGSGARDMEVLNDTLQQYTRPAFRYTSSTIGHYQGDELQLPEVYSLEDANAYVLFDNQIDSGKAMSDAVIYLFGRFQHGEGIVPPKRTYTAAEADWLEGGIANFAGMRSPGEYLGIKNFLRLNMPEEYERLAAGGLLEFADDEKKPMGTPELMLDLSYEMKEAAIAVDGFMRMLDLRLGDPSNVEEKRRLVERARGKVRQNIVCAEYLSDLSGTPLSIDYRGRQPGGARKKVLVVDDDPDVREVLSFVLTTKGYKALSAAGAAEALEMYAEGGVDCVIADIHMNQIGGGELLTRLKSLDPSAKVIMVSSRRGADERESLITKGALAVHEKSDYEAFLEVLRKAVE